jgi:glutaredoxin
MIFSKTTCPYCKAAKKLFADLKEPYYALELDTKGIELIRIISFDGFRFSFAQKMAAITRAPWLH